MEDMTYVNLDKQIQATEEILNSNRGWDSAIQIQMMENQLIIMKVLNDLDDKIRRRPF